jgi:hypothetical protein
MTRTAVDARTDYHDLLTRLTTISAKVSSNAGNSRTFSFPDWHQLSEGILLSAWARWESLLRELFILDLSTDTGGVLCRNVRATGFRYGRSATRLAEAIVDHPDASRFIDWNRLGDIEKRADDLLSVGHRFGRIVAPQKTTIEQIAKIRNAIAHNSDTAWEKFITVITNAPYSLSKNQRKGITVGRFITSHDVGGVKVITHFIDTLRSASSVLVP